MTDLTGDQPRPPPAAPPHSADPRLRLGREQSWTAMRPARPVSQTGERASLALARLPPPHPPPMHRRRRHPKHRRRLTHRHAALNNTNQRPPTSRSELRVTVHIHPSLPSCLVAETASREARMEPSAVHNVRRRDI